jgi:cell wall-associated NlpC family hydrolase
MTTRAHRWKGLVGTVLVTVATGCGPLHFSNLTTPTTKPSGAAANLAEVISSRYNPADQAVIMQVRPRGNATGETILDLKDPEGVIHYSTAQFPDKRIRVIKITYPDNADPRQPDIAALTAGAERYIEIANLSEPGTSPAPQTAAPSGTISLPPPGVKLDSGITPRAKLSASRAAKTDAVLSVARSKLGTPYVWGHNEDDGEQGFDCSNFTEYVYHHALGYRFTTSSRGQYKYVGVPVPASEMLPGDLLIFDNGRHVGIYAGNHQVIQEGGGLGKVGYLDISPGRYWSRHLSVVKRMY